MRTPVNDPPPIHTEDRELTPLFDPLYYATRVLIGFSQGVFKQLPRGKYKWSPSIEDTEVIITDTAPITLEALSFRPVILTTRGQANFMNSTMKSLEQVNTNTGHQVFRDIIQGSITFNCLSKNGVEASRLAWFLSSQVKALRVFLQRQGPFARIGHDVILQGEQPAGILVRDSADGGAVNVPVTIPFFMPYKWEVQEPAFIHDSTRVELVHKNTNDEEDTLKSYTITNEVQND